MTVPVGELLMFVLVQLPTLDPGQEAGPPIRRLTLAGVVDDKLYCTTSPLEELSLLRAQIHDQSTVSRFRVFHVGFPVRWRIFDDHFFALYEETWFEDQRHFEFARMPIPYIEKPPPLVDPNTGKRRQATRFFFDAIPLDHEFELQQAKEKPKSRVFYDFIVDEYRLLLFIHAGNTMTTWATSLPTVDGHLANLLWLPRESFTADFAEPFIAVPGWTGYFFVTDSGDIYAATRRSQGNGKAVKVWSGKESPIHGVVIEATGHRRGFAFGGDFVLELRQPDKLRAVKIDRSSPLDIAEPLRTLLPVARTFKPHDFGLP
jgi:hypothetical protein